MSLDAQIIEKAESYRPLAEELLKEAVRIPEDYVDETGGHEPDPYCGQSNHEGPRLEYLKKRIAEIGAVATADDVGFDGFGNLVWRVSDPDDGIGEQDRALIYFDGHTDTVQPLRSRWHEVLGPGIDPFRGLTDPKRVDWAAMERELGYLPPAAERHHLVFGRGTADQLSGVISQIIATKILLELRQQGTLKGATVVSYGTVCEEDNDGAGPMFMMREALKDPGEPLPDVVVLTEGTGCSKAGSCGIYRGQRGRMQIEVEIVGRSSHGSMPAEGLNPLEYAGAILHEAAERHRSGDGFIDHPFLGRGTRTASWAKLDSPSDCAVPERFTFRFDRRLTVGETPEQSLADIESLEAVDRARKAGLTVTISIPTYNTPTWKGEVAGNPQFYAGWVTPENHLAISVAEQAYRSVVTPIAKTSCANGGTLRTDPRITRWVFSTDGVGFPLPVGTVEPQRLRNKNWVVSGAYEHPAMLGIGPGIEQNTHKLGEFVDAREIVATVAMLARFPGMYAGSARWLIFA